MLVFAYGSNLDADDFREWCDRHGHRAARLDPVSPALLLDRALSFQRHSRGRGGGVLTLSARLGAATEGVVFEANEAAVEALDAKEGHPHAYRREAAHAILPDGRALPCTVYDGVPQGREGFVAPSDAYLAVVRRGLAAHGLSNAALAAAAANTPPPSAAPWLFVYGTLLAGEANDRHLAGLDRHPARVRGALHDCGPYPVVALGTAEVRGEALPLDPARLPALDALEGARPFGEPGGHYRRTVLPALLDDGRSVRAQVYVADDAPSFPAIPSGDWRSVGDRHAAWEAYAARATPPER